MFFTYFKKSLWTLPLIVLVPLVVAMLEVSVFNPEGRNFNITRGGSGSGLEDRADFSGDTFDLSDEDYEVDEELLDDEDFDVPDDTDSPSPSTGSSFNWNRIWVYGINPVFPIIANLLFLLILPCAIGGANYAAKKVLFYVGFVADCALALVCPLVFYYWNTWFPADSVYFASGYFAVMLLLYFAVYLVPFIAGSRLVASAYRKAFWFW